MATLPPLIIRPEDEQRRLHLTAQLALHDQPENHRLFILIDQFEEINRRIATGENEHFKIKSNGRHARWTLEYPGDSEAANHPFLGLQKGRCDGTQ